jgi:hypothetical protein
MIFFLSVYTSTHGMCGQVGADLLALINCVAIAEQLPLALGSLGAHRRGNISEEDNVFFCRRI